MILYGSGRNAINDKVAKLVRLVNEAQHEVLVINDSDVRVKPDYFRTVVAPLQNSKVGGVTCLYTSVHDATITQSLQSVGMISDFFPGVMVAWLLEHGAEVNGLGPGSRTPSEMSARTRWWNADVQSGIDVAKLLPERSSDPVGPDAESWAAPSASAEKMGGSTDRKKASGHSRPKPFDFCGRPFLL